MAEHDNRTDAAALLALIRDALPHISEEIENRKCGGQIMAWADLEEIERRMVDALRGPLPVYLVAYTVEGPDDPYACAFSSMAAAERFAPTVGGHAFETGIDTHALTAEDVEAMAEEATDKVRRRGVVGRRRARGKVARRTQGEG